jgi:hypothetical protein
MPLGSCRGPPPPGGGPPGRGPVPRCGVWAESGPAEGLVPEKPPGRASGAALDPDGGAVAGRGAPEIGGDAAITTGEGGFADAEGDEPGINRCGGAVAGTGVLEAAGAASAARTGSILAEPAATGAGPTGRAGGAGRSSPALARGATVADAANDDGAAAGLAAEAAVADPFPAAGWSINSRIRSTISGSRLARAFALTSRPHFWMRSSNSWLFKPNSFANS